MAHYIPKKGDFIIVTFDPQAGHEQKGRRPALVISNTLFNEHTGLAIVCPITNTYRNFPFHVRIPDQASLTGYVMIEHVKSIDFLSRKVKYVEEAPSKTLNEVLGIPEACIYEDVSHS